MSLNCRLRVWPLPLLLLLLSPEAGAEPHRYGPRVEVTAPRPDFQQELEVFLPLVPALDGTDDDARRQALERCRKLADVNRYAAEVLYWCHTRGQGGLATDYRAAQRYLDKAFTIDHNRMEIGDGFLNAVRHRLADLPPHGGVETLRILQFDPERHRHEWRNIALVGDHAPADCYREAMLQMGGGPAARVLMEHGTAHSSSGRRLRAEAARAGNLAADFGGGWQLLFDENVFLEDGRTMTARQFVRVRAAADRGHVPSQLLAAALLTAGQNGIPADCAAARRYLLEAGKVLADFRARGCRHGDGHERYRQKQWMLTPDPAWALEELDAAIQALNKRGTGERELEPFLLLREQKSPAYAVFRAGMRLTGTDPVRGWEMVRDAARQGETAAIRTLIVHESGNWEWPCLAGRNGLGEPYYEEAYRRFRQTLHPGMDAFYPALIQLAGVWPAARVQLREECRRLTEVLAPETDAAPREREAAKRERDRWQAAFRKCGVRPESLEVSLPGETAAPPPPPPPPGSAVVGSDGDRRLTLAEVVRYDRRLLRVTADSAVDRGTLRIRLAVDRLPKRCLPLRETADGRVELTGRFELPDGSRRERAIDMTVSPAGWRLRQLSATVRNLAAGETVEIVLMDGDRHGKRPERRPEAPSDYRSTPEDAAIFAREPREELQVFGLPPEQVFWNNGWLTVSLPARPEAGEVAILLPRAAAKREFGRYTVSLPPAAMAGCRVWLLFKSPDYALPAERNRPIPDYFYAPIHAVVLRGTWPAGRLTVQLQD